MPRQPRTILGRVAQPVVNHIAPFDRILHPRRCRRRSKRHLSIKVRITGKTLNSIGQRADLPRREDQRALSIDQMPGEHRVIRGDYRGTRGQPFEQGQWQPFGEAVATGHHHRVGGDASSPRPDDWEPIWRSAPGRPPPDAGPVPPTATAPPPRPAPIEHRPGRAGPQPPGSGRRPPSWSTPPDIEQAVRSPRPPLGRLVVGRAGNPTSAPGTRSSNSQPRAGCCGAMSGPRPRRVSGSASRT